MVLTPQGRKTDTLTIPNLSICVSPALGICLHIDFISITINVDLADILHPEGGVTQHDFEKGELLFSSVEQVKLIHGQ